MTTPESRQTVDYQIPLHSVHKNVKDYLVQQHTKS